MWDDVQVEKYRAGSCEPWTVDILRALIQAAVPRRIVETGTFEGLTTIQLAAVAPQATVLTIEQDAHRLAAATPLLAEYPNIQPVCGDALEILRGLPDESLDFVFLDDDHNPAHVYQEMTVLQTKMAPKGIVTCHDVFGQFNLHAVLSTFHGYSLDLPRLHAAGGLGIWQQR